jgi:hypothetical protein
VEFFAGKENLQQVEHQPHALREPGELGMLVARFLFLPVLL